LATRFNARKNLVKGWRLAGEVAGAARDWDEAQRALHEALRIAEEIGNPNQLWRTHAALGRMYSERGHEDAASRAAGDAIRVVDRVLAALPDPALGAGLSRLPLVGEMRARAAE